MVAFGATHLPNESAPLDAAGAINFDGNLDTTDVSYVVDNANEAMSLKITGNLNVGTMDVWGDTPSAVSGAFAISAGTGAKTSAFGTYVDGSISINSLNVGLNPVTVNGETVSRGFYIGGGEDTQATVNATIGSVNAQSQIAFGNLDQLNIAGVAVFNDAAQIDGVNSVTVGGKMTAKNGIQITAKNNVTLAGLDNSGVSTISAGGDFVSGSASVAGTVQNMAGAILEIEPTGNVTVWGDLDNKGNLLSVGVATKSAGDVTIDGVVNNENEIKIFADSLTVKGNDYTDDGAVMGASVVSKGDFTAVISGATSLNNGFDISGMANSESFQLITGTLNLGSANNVNNHLKDFQLNITGTGVTQLGDVVNGLNGDNVLTSAAMNITATNGTVNIANVRNVAGDMTVGGNNISVSGTLTNEEGSDVTTITATNNLAVTGGVTNNSEMHLGGAVVSAGSVTNNAGTLQVSGDEITVTGGISNVAGITTIQGAGESAGALTVGGQVVVSGGQLKLDAWNTESKVGGINVSQNALFTLGQNIGKLTVTGNGDATSPVVSLAGDLIAGGATDENTSLDVQSVNNFVMAADSIKVGGNASISAGKSIALESEYINVVGTVTVNGGALGLGTDATTGTVSVGDAMSATNGGKITLYSDNVSAKTLNVDADSLLVVDVPTADGSEITATGGDISVGGELVFGTATTGVSVIGNDLTLSANSGNISLGGIKLGANGNSLTLTTNNNVTVNGDISNTDGTIDINAQVSVSAGNVENTGTLHADAASITFATLDNSGTATFGSDSDRVGSFVVSNASENSGDLTVYGTTVNLAGLTNTAGNVVLNASSADDDMSLGAVVHSGGNATLTATKGISASGLDVDSTMNISAPIVSVTGDVSVAGLVDQGGNSGLLNLNTQAVTANNLSMAGFVANAGQAMYDVTGLTFGGDITINNGAHSAFFVTSNDSSVVSNVTAGNITNNSGRFALYANSGSVSLGDISNIDGIVSVQAKNGITLSNLTNSANYATSVVSLNAGSGFINLESLSLLNGNFVFAGAGLNLDSASQFAFDGTLYQSSDSLNAKDIDIASGDFVITTTAFSANGIKQTTGNTLVINTSDVAIGAGGIDVSDLQFNAVRAGNDWLNVAVAGDVSGGVEFLGLEYMDITGDYTFNESSKIEAAIFAANQVEDGRDYWATVSLNPDKTLGQITNNAGTDAEALITVGGSLISDIYPLGTSNVQGLGEGQIGLNLFSIVDQGTAIWLVHAQDSIVENQDNYVLADGSLLKLSEKFRDLNVKFCNADGSMCFNYLDSIKPEFNGSDDDLPAYISERDTDGDGIADSLYVVFDPRFGGPVEVFKIQPVVATQPGYTTGEFMSAGAIDELVAGQLRDYKFNNRTPIEAIPLIFQGTNMETLANELYDRMEYYKLSYDASGLVPFSRLFQVRELEQIAGAVVMNEHTSFRDFEDRMLDEFIWNRNRNLKKAWADVDFGMFSQNVSDNKRVYGNRFSIAGGFDWQESNTLILGLTGRVSHMSSDNSDSMELGYRPDANGVIQSIAGNVDMTVADTNIGLGGYLIQTLGEKTRVYGNAFLDLHVLDVDRNQNFVNTIDGGGTAFSLISEWGLMHDWLNQYIVGNIYARVGYNFGFSVTEQVDGDDYMDLESDGYLILTPGYTLTAQKRIYPSAWFQVRPYASVGVEYDVLGAPDTVQYKFAPADVFTDYAIDIDPLWANIGGGIEFISARGVQVGLDYRYQYNDAIQLHNIKVSGSYRF